jgi:hypothetical protein
MKRWMLLAVLSSLNALPVLPAQPEAAAANDPVGYCKAAGTRDSVRSLPSTLRSAAAAALGLPPGAAGSAGSEGYFWRCMDGVVYVCAVGANIPCQSKADAAQRNTGAEAFCKQNPDAESVPAYATGHRTIYGWRCVSGAAVHGKPAMRLDRRGFQADFWHRLAAREPGYGAAPISLR